MVQFDSVDPYEVIHSMKPLKEVPKLDRNSYVPRSQTPLLDAMGRGINDLESHLSKLKEDERPARVVVAIITDGQENASREFNKDQIVKMINERTEKDDWQFVFLSSDLSAIQDAGAYGFKRDKSLHFQKTSAGTLSAFASLSSDLSDYRKSKKNKMGFQPEPDGKKGK
ncbi:hypothetical protein GF413_03250 [Candidatus Micrarchaeota archaeon]|nr:hypothetical protein [Candidatus Micrarchaeota archaeon]